MDGIVQSDDQGFFRAIQFVLVDTEVTLTSSDPSVGSVTSPVTIAANGFQSDSFSFEALTAGTTNVSAMAAGFGPSGSDDVDIVVLPSTKGPLVQTEARDWMLYD